MSVGLRADRPGRAMESGAQARVFAGVDIGRSRIRGTVPVSRQARHAAVYYARNGRHDQPWCVRSCSARVFRRLAAVTHLSIAQLRHFVKRLGPICFQQS